MDETTLIFPHQLYSDHPGLKKGRAVCLIEDRLFFHQFSFHCQKLALHRASMQSYAALLRKKGFGVNYYEAAHDEDPLQSCFHAMKRSGIQAVHYSACTDYLLERRMRRHARRHGMKLIRYASPNFICSDEYLEEYFRNRKRYFLTSFYIDQRKRLNIMVEQGRHWGEKWTYDTENRKKIPPSLSLPDLPTFASSEHRREAVQYVAKNFPSAIGTPGIERYPVTHAEATTVLQTFFRDRFHLYGSYQDAIVSEGSFLFHSLLTPALNIGLLAPRTVIDAAIAYASGNNVPLNALEGFVRQVLGWREFMRALYEQQGVTQRTSNYWAHFRKIPASFWEGTTGIVPVDNVIHKALRTAYSHHIERLMVMGNFMLLCEFHPDEVYRWFMTFYIDAYDWVMVPNVYGMSQYADGGIVSTKPYISGSNYLVKMSDFKKGEWSETWDGLYWRFIHVHRDTLIANPRMTLIVKQLMRMDAGKLSGHLQNAERFLQGLDQSI